MNWREANQYCQDREGNLVSIHSDREEEELLSFTGFSSIWIGGHDLGGEVCLLFDRFGVEPLLACIFAH